jgi:hypothetical protein
LDILWLNVGHRKKQKTLRCYLRRFYFRIYGFFYNASLEGHGVERAEGLWILHTHTHYIYIYTHTQRSVQKFVDFTIN